MTQKAYPDLTARGALQGTDIIAVYPTGGPLQRSTNTALLTYLSATFVRLDGADAMSGALLLPNGAVGTPSLTFTNSPTTGVWSPGAGTFAASAGGVEIFRSTATLMTMSKELKLAVTGAASVPLNLPAGVADVSSPAQGDIWNNGDTISYRASGQTLTVPLMKEGTFTPACSFVTAGSSSFVYAIQEGQYVRVGNLVHIEIRLQFTPTLGTASGNFQITGLPYGPIAPNDVGIIIGGLGSFKWTSGDGVTASAGGSLILLKDVSPAGNGAVNFTTTNLQNGVNHSIVLSGDYITSDAF